MKTEFAEAAGIGSAEERLPGVFWTVGRGGRAGRRSRATEGGKRVVVPGLLNRASALTGQHSPRMLVLPLAERVWRRGALD